MIINLYFSCEVNIYGRLARRNRSVAVLGAKPKKYRNPCSRRATISQRFVIPLPKETVGPIGESAPPKWCDLSQSQ